MTGLNVARGKMLHGFQCLRGLGQYDDFLRRLGGGTEVFETKLENWIRFWAQHCEISDCPGQLGLLLFDEPHSEAQFGLSRRLRK